MYISGSLALIGLAVPCVLGQTLDWAAVTPLSPYSPSIDSTATAQTVSYNPTAAASSIAAQISSGGSPSKRDAPALEKRQSACSPLPTGSGPVPSPDTPDAFEADPFFANAALSAVTPAGYNNTFTNLNCSNNAYGYMGFQDLDTYDVGVCASICDSTTGCIAFNICNYLPAYSVVSGTDCSKTSNEILPNLLARTAPTRPARPTSSVCSGGALLLLRTPTTADNGKPTSKLSSPVPMDM